MAQIKANGLVIKSGFGDAHLPAPPCLLSGNIKEPFYIIVVSCKAYDLDQAMESFAPAVGPETGILPLLNGMRHLALLSARFGATHVLGGLCMLPSALAHERALRPSNALHTDTKH